MKQTHNYKVVGSIPGGALNWCNISEANYGIDNAIAI